MKRWEIVLPGFVPDRAISLNGRAHWRTVAAHKRDARLRMLLGGLGWSGSHGPLPCFERARVTFEFVFPVKRKRDQDNLTSLGKPLLDGLVRDLEMIPDDDTEHVELVVRALVQRGITETRVTVEELEIA